MSRICQFCLKSAVAGNRVQHHHAKGWRFRAPRSKRQFKPNLRSVKLAYEGEVISATICMKCYKKLRNESSHEVSHHHNHAQHSHAK